MNRLVSICLLQVVALSSFAQSADAPIEKYIEEKFRIFSEGYPGVSVTVIRGKDVFWRKDTGNANIETGTIVSETTKFNIYSTSKYIVGLAYLKLAYNKDIALNKKIRDIDPSLPVAYKDITIEHLLTHTSGIRHYRFGRDWAKFANLTCESPEDAMQHFINDPLKANPGDKELYTTYGFVVLSHILEKITGKNFQDAINALLPFSSTLELDGLDKSKATPYVKRGKAFKAYPNLNAKCKYGGGGFIATSDQLAEAGRMLYSGEVAPLREVKELFRSQWKNGKSDGTAFGTGAWISNETFGKQDVLCITKGGGSPGGRSYLFVVADLEISVAITANLEGDGDEAFELAKDIVMKIGESK